MTPTSKAGAFGKLYDELCLLAGKKLERMGLWHWLSEAGFSPAELTKEEALYFLDSRGEDYLSQAVVLGPRGRHPHGWTWADLEQLSKTIKLWNPKPKTLEGILERICPGLSELLSRS